MTLSARITGSGSYLPAKVLTNKDHRRTSSCGTKAGDNSRDHWPPERVCTHLLFHAKHSHLHFSRSDLCHSANRAFKLVFRNRSNILT